MSKYKYKYYISERAPTRVYIGDELHGDPNLETLLGWNPPSFGFPDFEFPESGRLILGPGPAFFYFRLDDNATFDGFTDGTEYQIKAEGSGLLGAVVYDQETPGVSPITARLIGLWGDSRKQEQEYWANNYTDFTQDSPAIKRAGGSYIFTRGTANSIPLVPNMLLLANLDAERSCEFNSLSFKTVLADRPYSTCQDNLD